MPELWEEESTFNMFSESVPYLTKVSQKYVFFANIIMGCI